MCFLHGRRMAGGAAASPLLTDLVAYWNLDEASGTRVDSHTNGLDLTDNNTVGSGLGVDGVSTAADFESGNGEYLSRASAEDWAPNGQTVYFAAWVNPESLASDGAFWGATSPFSHQFCVKATSGDLFVDAWCTNAATPSIVGALSVGTWAFCEFKIDTATQKVGVAVNGGAWTETSYTSYTAQGAMELFIGARSAGGTLFDGLMQGVGIWRRVPTADERTWLYNSGAAARTYAQVAAYTG